MSDGSPQVAPVWVDLEGDSILVSTGEGSLKAKNTRRDARVGVSIIAMDNPYREAQLRGRIVERRPDPDFKTMDRISRKYTGKSFPFRDNPTQRVVLVIEVARARFAALQRSAGQNPAFVVAPGNHTWTMVAGQVPAIVAFLDAGW